MRSNEPLRSQHSLRTRVTDLRARRREMSSFHPSVGFIVENGGAREKDPDEDAVEIRCDKG